ncbi:MAG: hypothetical protein GY934_22140, partial [Gammaproteobacteria bacterium]|nr:hypothetical protein [Gammaproteobacteria bacterium]
MGSSVRTKMSIPGGGPRARLQAGQILRQAFFLWVFCCFLAGGAAAQCDVTLSNHDGGMDNAYAWVYSGNETGEQGSFAECFSGDFTICQLQVHLTQVGNASGSLPNQTFDVYVWQDDGTGKPGAVISHTTAVAPGTIAQWPNFSLHEINLSDEVSGDWWVGIRRNETPGAADWL